MVGGAVMSILSIAIADAKTYASSIELRLSYISQGVMTCTISENLLVMSTSGKNEHKTKTLNFHLFKLYPDYNVHFIGYNNDLIGSHLYTKKEMRQFPEHKYKRNNILEYNALNYNRLLEDFSIGHKELLSNNLSFSSDFIKSSSGKNYGIIPTSYGYYVGKCQDGKPLVTHAYHYFDNNNSFFLGTVKDGRRTGEGINYEYENTNNSRNLIRITKGIWDYGSLNGYVEQQDLKNHTFFCGNFKNGYKVGKGVLIDSTNNLQLIGEWKTLYGGFEYLSGLVEEKTLNGDLLYCGAYKWGKRHGYGTEKSMNGNQYKGFWKKGKRHGKGIAYIKIDYNRYNAYREKWKKGQLKKQVKYEK